MEIVEPVPGQGIADVPPLVIGGVLVDFDYADVRVIEVLNEPIRPDEHLGVRKTTHVVPSSIGTCLIH